MTNQGKTFKTTLKPGHVIHTMMSEHEKILGFLDELEKINQKIQKMEAYKEGIEFQRLKNITHHLIEADSHHQREETVLFPELRKRGFSCGPDMMEIEHKDLKKYKKKLKKLVERREKIDFSEFKKELAEIVNFLLPVLREHIFKEDNVLYPTALELIKDQKVWEQMKIGCDKIGYCCFTPKI